LAILHQGVKRAIFIGVKADRHVLVFWLVYSMPFTQRGKVSGSGGQVAISAHDGWSLKKTQPLHAIAIAIDVGTKNSSWLRSTIDPSIFITDLQDANQNYLKKSFSA
jgi:hypothetical protein